MKYLIFIFTGLIYAAAYNQYDIITTPSVSRRCLGLADSRIAKINTIQRVRILQKRNQSLKLKLMPRQKKALQKLEYSEVNLSAALRKSEKRLIQLEEQIIRSGCPTIKL